MTQSPITTKAELLAQIDEGWHAFQAALAEFSEEDLTVPQDPQGWTVKDHVIHLMAWERSCVYLLQGKPRHDGLGVDEITYLRGVDDEINAVIHAQTQTIPLEDVLPGCRAIHQTLIGLIARLSDAELQRPYRHYLPDEPGEGDGPPAIDVICGNTIEHYAEHLPWMHALVAPGSHKHAG